jgi:hypothetical protein
MNIINSCVDARILTYFTCINARRRAQCESALTLIDDVQQVNAAISTLIMFTRCTYYKSGAKYS